MTHHLGALFQCAGDFANVDRGAGCNPRRACTLLFGGTLSGDCGVDNINCYSAAPFTSFKASGGELQVRYRRVKCSPKSFSRLTRGRDTMHLAHTEHSAVREMEDRFVREFCAHADFCHHHEKLLAMVQDEDEAAAQSL
eukprot:10890548-Prorocentrum_lima.AAC.1